MARIPYKTRLEARTRQASRLGKCFGHSTNKGEVVRLPFAKPILDAIEEQRKIDAIELHRTSEEQK